MGRTKRKESRSDKARKALKEKRKKKAQLVAMAKDVVIAVVIVCIVMASLYAYSGGIWPPMVVVESESMMHDDDSKIGVIDTGDLTLVKRIESRSDIVTYVEGAEDLDVGYRTDLYGGGTETGEMNIAGRKAGHSKYGDHGDVIIYRKNGRGSETPVIHRAMVWIEVNDSASCRAKITHGWTGADFPDIRNSDHPKGLRCVTQITLRKTGFKKVDVQINVNTILNNAVAVKGEPFSGFLTKGDNNNPSSPSRTDQETHRDGLGRGLAPIRVNWVVGKSVGELPWFGALKLVLSKPPVRTPEEIPPSTWRGLIITIVLIVVVPFILDIASMQITKRLKKRKKGKDDEGEEEEEKEGSSKKKAKRAKERSSDEEEVEEEGEGEEEEEDLEDLEMDDEFDEDFEEMEKETRTKGRKRR